MKTPNQSSEQGLCDEIMAEAQRKADQLIRGAQQQAAALLAKTADDMESVRQQRLAKARTEGERRRKHLLATIPLERNRLRAAKIESVLQSIYVEVQERLNAHSNFDYPGTLILLATEAMKGMSGDAFVVKLSPTDHTELGEKLVREIAGRMGNSPTMNIKIEVDPSITESGLIVLDSEGHQAWDNRLSVRLGRMWPELRRQLALSIPGFSEDNSTGGNL